MTRVRFDAPTGRLRLEPVAFDALARWARGAEAPGEAIASLREAGVVEGDRPHPALAAAVAAVAEPICRLRVDLVDQDGCREAAEGWIAAGCAALLLDLPDGLRELASVHPVFLPASLARIVRLGPRPRLPGGALESPGRRLDELLATDPVLRRQAAEALCHDRPAESARALVEPLVAAPWTVWEIEVSWSGPGGAPASRSLRVADTVVGLLRIERAGETATFNPTTPTRIWRRLTLLPPGDEELA